MPALFVMCSCVLVHVPVGFLVSGGVWWVSFGCVVSQAFQWGKQMTRCCSGSCYTNQIDPMDKTGMKK